MIDGVALGLGLEYAHRSDDHRFLRVTKIQPGGCISEWNRAKRPLRDTSTRIVETGDYVMGVRIYAETGPVRSRGEWSAEQLYMWVRPSQLRKFESSLEDSYYFPSGWARQQKTHWGHLEEADAKPAWS